MKSGIHSEFISALNLLKRPLFVLDGDQRCLFANPAFYRSIGAPAGSELLVARFCPEVLSWPTSLETGSAALFREDGSVDSVALSTVPLGEGLRLFAIIESSADLANVVDLHSQRLETLGMLAGGVAHDFNNVLTGILGHISYLKSILPRSGQHTESVTAIEEGARRASSMTQQILNFSKLDHGERPIAIDVRALVENTCRLLRGAVPHDRTFEIEIDEFPLYVLGVEGKIAQVLINLVMNSRDATESGGLIRLCVSSVTDPAELNAAFHGRDLSSAEYARISVVDDGHGMDEEVRRRLFEPYFSTKGGKGTGLGMATVQRIVVLFGGAISVDSAVGRGTCVSVYLPLTQSLEDGTAARPAEFELARRGAAPERILIVDDEYPVRNVLCMSLEHLGYEVDVASSGEEAVAKFETARTPYDLVLLDMIMPNLSGDQVFARLQELDAGVRVLVMSGFTSEASVQGVLDRGGLDFMPKPFTIEELARKVRHCLDSAR